MRALPVVVPQPGHGCLKRWRGDGDKAWIHANARTGVCEVGATTRRHCIGYGLLDRGLWGVDVHRLGWVENGGLW